LTRKTSALILILLQCLLAAVFFVLSKLAFNRGVEPLNFSAQVLLAAGVFMLGIQVVKQPQGLFRFSLRGWIFLLLAAFFGGGLAYAFRFLGIKYSSAVNCGFLGQSSVVFTALLAHFLLKEKLGWRKAGLIVLLLLGCYLVATSGQLMIPHPGDWFLLGAAIAFSLGVIAAKLGLQEIPALVFSGYRALLGGVFLLVYLRIIGVFTPQVAWVWVLPVGIVVALAILTINIALHYTSASYVTMMSAFIPVFTVLLAYPFLGERLDLPQVAGGILILVSGWLCHQGNIGQSV